MVTFTVNPPVSSGITQAQLNAVSALIPTVATSAPPAVAANSAVGNATSMYAAANHTHASSVQSTRIAVVGSSGLVTWTFPIAFAASPICVAVAECASGATQPFVTNIVGTASTTAVTFQVFKTATVTLPGLATSLLGYVVSVFGIAPAGTYIHIMARLPS